MNISIARIGQNKTVGYAARELSRYLKQMDPALWVDLRVYDAYSPEVEKVLWLGLDGSVPQSEEDEIRIDVQDGCGVITGSSERAVLIGVYRFLFELGCRFLRPGADGEVIPKKLLTPEALTAKVHEKASARHRGVCIEGAVSYEHVANMIDYLPKVGMNGYFMQFHTPTTFFTRFYNDENSKMGLNPITSEEVARMWKSIEEEIALRGLDYHATGHGWTCEPFGISAGGWDKVPDEETPAEIRTILAEVDGKRCFWKGAPLNTNLCYSNPVVREKMTDAIVNYCKVHTDVNFLHLWLADGSNNHCECAECRKKIPSDFYVDILNLLDQKMADAGIETKVVCLIYCDLLWAPKQERIANPDRFVLMFAPITRTYTTSFAEVDLDKIPELPPYVRNQLIRPTSVAENVAHLNKWQQEQKIVDSFDFDYHLMWDHSIDPGYYECARILHRDMTHLDKLGLKGMMSCQLQRTFFPTGLPFYAMAKGLWDKESQFEEIAAEYFTAAFGEEAKAVEAYLSELSVLFDPAYTRKEKPLDPAGVETRMKAAKERIDGFYAQYKDKTGPSWELLKHHANFTKQYANTLAAYLGDGHTSEERETEKQKLMNLCYELEPYVHEGFDPHKFKDIFRRYWDKFCTTE